MKDDKQTAQPSYKAYEEWQSLNSGNVSDFIGSGYVYTNRGVPVITNILGDVDSQRNVQDLVHEQLLVILRRLAPLANDDVDSEKVYHNIRYRVGEIREHDFNKTLQDAERLLPADLTHQDRAFLKVAREFADAVTNQGGLVHVERPVTASWKVVIRQAAKYAWKKVIERTSRLQPYHTDSPHP